VKTTLVEQIESTPNKPGFGQVVVWLKLLAFVPVMAMLVMFKSNPPELVSFTDFEGLAVLSGTLPKFKG